MVNLLVGGSIWLALYLLSQVNELAAINNGEMVDESSQLVP